MKYFLIAGEKSGDDHGAMLMEAIRKIDNIASFEFVGGVNMQNVGGTLCADIEELSVMGFVEVVQKLPGIFKIANRIKSSINSFRPDIIIFIDFPGLNLRLAKWAKLNGYKTCYYILPKVWAWKKGRIEIIRNYVDLPIGILPFEKEFYQKSGVKIYFLGNPSLDKIISFTTKSRTAPVGNSLKIAILPGSRKQEVEQMLSVFYEAAQQIPKAEIFISKSPNLPESLYRKIITNDEVNLSENFYQLLKEADVAIVTSGTATLEAALFNVPQVVGYKTSAITYYLAKLVVRLPYISLINLIAETEVVKELIQHECVPKNIGAEIKKLLILNDKERAAFYNSFFENMGSKGGVERTANLIFNHIKQH